MAEVLEQSLPYRVKLLEGPDAGTTVELLGRALPYRGTVYETEQRLKTTWYPGNPVATQQVMGPVDKPTTINGIWKDRFLGNGVAKQLVDTFEGLCRSGYSVEVSWGQGMLPEGTMLPGPPAGPKWPIIRRGIIKNIKATYDRPQDIAWELVFEWLGRDEAAAPPLTQAGLLSNQNGFDQIKVEFSDSQDGISAFRESPLAQLAGVSARINAALDEAQKSIDNMVGFVDSATTSLQDIRDFGNVPREVIERGRLLAAQGADSLRRANDALLSIPLSLLTQVDSALTWLDAVTQIFDTIHQNDEAQESANNTTEALAKQMRPEVLAELRPVPGSDLRDVAREWYGDPDLWYIIADFNNLSSSVVPFPPDGLSDNSNPPIRVPQRPQGVTGAASPTC